jgi:NAD-dependent deacetylase
MAYETLIEYIENAENIVFLGGAGVSTESNIPDFRSADGLYHQENDQVVSPEELLSIGYMKNNTKMFYDFYINKVIHLEAKPNITHEVLAKLETIGKLKAVITQNIDGLHQKAGSQNVIELHGSIYDNYCTQCHKKYTVQTIVESQVIPMCDDCGGVIRPNVVLYGEGLDTQDVNDAIDYIANADLLIVGGTSLVVYPAAGLINYFKGESLVLINRDKTPYDRQADLVIHDNLGDVFKAINEKI